MNQKPLVYLAGPMSRGDIAINSRSQLLLKLDLIKDGIVVPFAPAGSLLAHLIEPVNYEMWLAYDFDVIRHCDALLRRSAVMPATEFHETYIQEESRGADREVEFAKEIGIPVFSTIIDLYDWAKRRTAQ